MRVVAEIVVVVMTLKANTVAVGCPVVVLCHAGVRSQHFGLWLLEQKTHGEVWNLEGGIDAWSVQVDSQVPRY